jgi:hypothetical protein
MVNASGRIGHAVGFSPSSTVRVEARSRGLVLNVRILLAVKDAWPSRLKVDQVKQQLRRRCTTGYDLGAKVNRSRDRALYESAMRYFGTALLRHLACGPGGSRREPGPCQPPPA